MRKGLTLIELIITTAMVAILTVAMAYILRVVLLSWPGQEARAGIDIGLNRGIGEMARDLKEARRVSEGNDEIRFTQDNSTFYIYYFYNPSDTYPLGFTQSSYH
ncbi:MAG: prepilin-type N-terminal cleavage/methylation domain-containing protein, partial [Candidatus Omnitrophota bacterium]